MDTCLSPRLNTMQTIPALNYFASQTPPTPRHQRTNQHHSRLRNQGKCIQRVDCVYARCIPSSPHLAIFPSFHPNPTERFYELKEWRLKKYHCSARTPTLISTPPPTPSWLAMLEWIIPKFDVNQ